MNSVPFRDKLLQGAHLLSVSLWSSPATQDQPFIINEKNVPQQIDGLPVEILNVSTSCGAWCCTTSLRTTHQLLTPVYFL